MRYSKIKKAIYKRLGKLAEKQIRATYQYELAKEELEARKREAMERLKEAIDRVLKGDIRAITQVADALGDLLITIILLIIVGVLGIVLAVKFYARVEPDITAINNTEVKTAVTTGITEMFNAFKELGTNLPFFVFAIIGAVILLVVIYVFSVARTGQAVYRGGVGGFPL